MQKRVSPIMIGLTLLISSALLADESKDEQRAMRLERMRSLAESVKFYGSTDVTSQDAAIKMHAKHVFRFDDISQRFHDGTIWLHGDQGRPSAVVAIERYKKHWSFELVSLATGPITAVSADGWRMSVKEPGLVLKTFSTKPAEAKSPADRLRQMKGLARMFQVEEVRRNGQRYDLRLLTQPVHRYANTESGIVDGGMFILVVGLNPEAICLVECIQKADGELSWCYGWAPLGAAKIWARLDGQVVWEHTQAGGLKSPKPYTIVTRGLEPTIQREDEK